mgnify:CR=1 FL=1
MSPCLSEEEVRKKKNRMFETPQQNTLTLRCEKSVNCTIPTTTHIKKQVQTWQKPKNISGHLPKVSEPASIQKQTYL